MKNYCSPKYLMQLMLLVLSLLGINAAQAAQHCSDEYSIDQTLTNGARWDMCWTHDDNHGIRYHHIYYTPKDGIRRMVLMDGAISQIHVPYDDNGARYHDVSDYGLGRFYLRSMTNAECPDGTLHQYGAKNAVCSQVKKKNNAYRFGATTGSQETLKVFSLSKVGAYVYIPEWHFYDDGKIEPSLVATGALQRYTPSDQFGWLVDDGKIGVSHVHNYFWRLDFDLGGTAEDDIVQEINYAVSAGKRERSVTAFSTEAARSLSPSQQRSWMISDGSLKNSKNHAMGYELSIGNAGHREIGPSFEPFTNNDFYVTKAKSCEQIASHNKRINTCDADSLDQFVNGESLSNEDLVVWVGLSFYHMPRAEDYPNMDVHSNTFKIIPRDWHANNPLKTLVVIGKKDTAATVSGSLVTIDALANDTGAGITLSTVSTPANGTAVINNGKIDYTPGASFVGVETFTYNIISPSGVVYPVDIEVTVTAPIVATPLPVANADAITIQQNTTAIIDVLGNDTGSVLVLQPLNSSSNNGGTVSILTNQIQYTPAQDYTGTDTFSYTFEDSEGRVDGAVVTVTVEGPVVVPNNTPVASDQNVQLATNLSANITLNATDADGDTLTYQVVRAPTQGTLTGAAPNLVYTPAANFSGIDSFTFIAADSMDDSFAATVSITVNAETSDAFSNLLSRELVTDGSASDWSTIPAFPNDPDDVSTGQINWRSVAMAHDASKVHLIFENHGNVRASTTTGSYLPWGWQVYMDTDKNSQTGFQVGDIGADFILEGSALHRYAGLGTNWNWENVAVTESQYRGSVAELNFPRSKIGNPDAMYLLMQGNNAAVGGTEVDSYPDGQADNTSSTRHFHYQFVSPNSSGLIASPQSLNTNINNPISIVLSSNGSLQSVVSYRIVNDPANGTVTGNPPTLTYIPNTGFAGSDSFTFVANDGTEDSAESVIAVQVNQTSTSGLSNNTTGIEIDGDSSDWNNLLAFNSDPNDMALSTDTINWQNVTMAHSDTDLYVLYRNHGVINEQSLTNDYIPWGWQTYLDTDDDVTTGFQVGDIGADFLIEATQVVSYSGVANSWSWDVVEAVDLFHKNDLAEMSFPLSAIGSPASMRVVFKGNNLSVGGSETDLYPDNASISGAENNYFSYSIGNDLQTTSQRPPVSSQEVDVVVAQTIQVTLNPTAARDEVLSYRLITPPTNGLLGVLGPTVDYTPNAGYVGEDSFEYVLNDGKYDSSLARVNLSIAEQAAQNSDEDGVTTGGGSFSLSMNGLIILFLLLINRRRVRRIQY